MKRITTTRARGKNIYLVELTPDEWDLPDNEIVDLADELEGSCHFGGRVKKAQEGLRAIVTVYTD